MRSVLFLAAMSAALPMWAQTKDDLHILNVEGQAHIEVEPDSAVLRYGTVSQAKNADDALETLGELSREIQNVVLSAGLKPEDLQTSQLQVQPVYDDGKVTGYRASNLTVATIADLELLPTILATLGDAGVNRIDGIDFQISNKDTIQDDALRLAIDDAKAKADLVVEQLGVTLGSPLTVNIHSNDLGPRFPVEARAFAADSASAPIAVSPGQIIVDAGVAITFELLPN